MVDIAFASEASKGGFVKVTKKFIDGLGPRLAAWVDHHDSQRHVDYQDDPRFVLATKAQHGACPEMITPELVARIEADGPVDSVVCHTDFDGLVSAAKWMRKGIEPYPGADDDARAIDTRIGKASAVGQRFDRALRARPRDQGLMGLMVRHLATGFEDKALWRPIDEAAAEMVAIEGETRRVSQAYRRLEPGVALVDAARKQGRIDKTMLLLLGQERETIAVVVDGDTVTLAAPFHSGVDFLKLFGLSGGMPTRVSLPRKRLPLIYSALGLDADEANRCLLSG